MTFANQSIPQLFVLLATGLALSVIGSLLVTNYRGYLTRYAHSRWKHYQKPYYQKLFLWTKKQRGCYADEAFIRKTIRIPAAIMAVMGLGFLALEVAALALGHVV